MPRIAANLRSVPRVLQNLVLTASASGLVAGPWKVLPEGRCVSIESVRRDIVFVPPTPLTRSAQRRGLVRSDVCRLHREGLGRVRAPRRGPVPQPRPEAGTRRARPECPLLRTLRGGPRHSAPCLEVVPSSHDGTSSSWPDDVPPCGWRFRLSTRRATGVWVFPLLGARASCSCVQVSLGTVLAWGCPGAELPGPAVTITVPNAAHSRRAGLKQPHCRLACQPREGSPHPPALMVSFHSFLCRATVASGVWPWP